MSDETKTHAIFEMRGYTSLSFDIDDARRLRRMLNVRLLMSESIKEEADLIRKILEFIDDEISQDKENHK